MTDQPTAQEAAITKLESQYKNLIEKRDKARSNHYEQMVKDCERKMDEVSEKIVRVLMDRKKKTV